MKIALLSAASSIHTIRWANALNAAGITVHVITQHSLLEPLEDGVVVHKFPFRGSLGYFTMVPGVKKLLQKIQPNILNAHFASGYATTARLVGFHPWLLSVWGTDVYSFPYKSILHKHWVRSNILSADRVASTSFCMAEQTYLIAPTVAEIFITPFGVDAEYYANLTTPLADREPDAPLTIGTVKALEPKYGVDILIDAFSLVCGRLRETQPTLADRLRLRLVGEGPQREELERQVKRLGLEAITEFVGRVAHDRVPIELEKIDIYVALSRQESFGVAIIEAGAAARPVVVSDAGGLPEVVKHNKTGLVVSSENPLAACEAMLRLVESSELRIQLGHAGQQHVKEHYAWSVCVKKMVSTLENVSRLNSS